MSKNPVTVGGQAVIEGVMMRGPHGYAISVRRADGSIETEAVPHVPLARRRPLFKLPILRGAAGLFEMMAIGYKSLEWSANRAALDDPAMQKKAAEKAKKGKEGKQEVKSAQAPLSRMELAGTMAMSVLFGIMLFVVLPNLSTHFLGKANSGPGGLNPFVEEESPVLYNLVSGAIRLTLVVGYIYLISLMKDVQRLFQYHGAEHKAVSAFEAGRELTVANVRPFTRLHPRCGTTFIAITVLVSILVFALFAKLLVAVWPEFYSLSFGVRKTLLILGHILIMPVVAGVCFELLRLGGRFPNNPLLRILITPGFWFQHLTVKEPDDSMIEVAIEALKSAMALPAPATDKVTATSAQQALAAAAAFPGNA